MVHYNSKYANLSEAATKEDGLAVLGAFIGVSAVIHQQDTRSVAELSSVLEEKVVCFVCEECATQLMRTNG